tara:strand:+ start:2268 stop:2831 length:564 start_codon:yes stop_codon:yes gene_type:complete
MGSPYKKRYSNFEKTNRARFIWDNFLSKRDCANILDCASGDGRKGIQYWMYRGLAGSSFFAIDAVQDLLNKLRDIGVNTACLDLEKTSIEKKIRGDFDIIICTETLEHLTPKTARRLIGSFSKLINKLGDLIITYPKKVKFNKKKYGHITQPNTKKLISHAGKSGFQLQAEYCINNKSSVLLHFVKK